MIHVLYIIIQLLYSVIAFLRMLNSANNFQKLIISSKYEGIISSLVVVYNIESTLPSPHCKPDTFNFLSATSWGK
jgi:hypothetical protein